MGATKNNECHEESIGLLKDKKVYYVVFSPLMSFPGRGFLAEDENGII